jgi:8-oxo-dGTP pyrophosphatase MutT (NUDIX family)
MCRPWKLTGTRDLVSTRIFRLTARRGLSPRTGEEHEFYVLESPDWVNVIPLLDDGSVVLVRQYRHARQVATLEIPGGMIDPQDASPADAARRELLEETGYWAERLDQVGVIDPNPAILSNACYSFVATGLQRRAVQQLDSTEEIEILTAPLAEIPSMIREGKIAHSLVVVAFCHYLGLRASGFGQGADPSLPHPR